MRKALVGLASAEAATCPSSKARGRAAKNQVTCNQPEPLGSAQATKVIRAPRPISSMPVQSPEALVAIERTPNSRSIVASCARSGTQPRGKK